MSAISQLNQFYGSFFSTAVVFSGSPYSLAYASQTAGLTQEECDTNTTSPQRHAAGIMLCVGLTIIPILPVLTAITLSLSLIGAALAAISALFTYPTALMMDSTAPPQHEF